MPPPRPLSGDRRPAEPRSPGHATGHQVASAAVSAAATAAATAAAPAVAEAYEPDARFIPPPPMVSEPEPVEPPASRTADADAFAAADLVNSARRDTSRPVAKAEMPSRKMGRTLFDRVTGAARAFHEATQASPAPARRAPEPQPSGMTPDAEAPGDVDRAPEAGTRKAPAAREVAGQETAPRSTVRRETSVPAAAASQSRLAGLDPSDRLGPSSGDEDLLDIPAFLRRQAN